MKTHDTHLASIESYDIEVTTSELADILYCMEVTSWAARTQGNEPLRAAVQRLHQRILETSKQPTMTEVLLGTVVPPDVALGSLHPLAHEHHRSDLEARWVRLMHDDVVALTVSAERLVEDTPDVTIAGMTPRTETTLNLTSIVRRWEEAPSCCPHEVRCSSYPNCACSGGVPV